MLLSQGLTPASKPNAHEAYDFWASTYVHTDEVTSTASNKLMITLNVTQETKLIQTIIL